MGQGRGLRSGDRRVGGGGVEREEGEEAVVYTTQIEPDEERNW